MCSFYDDNSANVDKYILSILAKYILAIWLTNIKFSMSEKRVFTYIAFHNVKYG